MFLDKVTEKNKKLLDAAFLFHQSGEILPDTYIIDMDTLIENAKKILYQAKQQNIKLYFMLKQVGRNPYIAKKLIKLGYEGAVVVDFKEAEIMMKHGIPISNVGHLVQPPKAILQRLIQYGCTYISAYSFDKIRDINTCAEKAGIVQKIMVKVVGTNDIIYSGQTAGFKLADLPFLISKVKSLKHIKIEAVTSFPCFLFDEQMLKIIPTPNLETLRVAKQIFENAGIEIKNVNAPSTTSVLTLQQMKGLSINSGEPGHSLTGTTPMHAYMDCEELPCVIYVSEISHNFNSCAYCYGGGFYRRSHMKNAYVGKSMELKSNVQIISPDLESIDYYIGINKECTVNDTVIMAFRFQMFVTRSNVCLIEGIHQGNPHIVGLYTSLGEEI